MKLETLTKDDKKRVNSCEYYQMTRNIMASHEIYKNIEVGEVFSIKYKNYDNTYDYVSRSGSQKDKYVAFHKDDKGFVFMKRINATGKLGVEVQCLTTQYPTPRYEVESDADYVDSLIFDDGQGYDPLAAEKIITKKKGQARRKNKKIELYCDTYQEAYEHIKTYKVGDVLYDCATTYGSGMIAWKITNIIKRATDQTQPSWTGRPAGNTNEDRRHNKEGFSEMIQLELTPTNSSKERRYSNSNKTIIFSAFTSRYSKYYKEKPYTVEDF